MKQSLRIKHLLMRSHRSLAAALLCAPLLLAQSNPPPGAPQPQRSEHARNSNIGGVFPVRYTVQPGEKVSPLSTREKFIVATQNSFDLPAFLVPIFIGGTNMAQGRYREFDDGVGAVGKYYGTAFLDQTASTYMSSAIFPSLFHQDPRYYRLGEGTVSHRGLYAISRVFITPGDRGNPEFNVSEIAGSGFASALANAYYPERTRSANDTLTRWATQIGTDAFFNVLKEFSSALNRHTPHLHKR